jgi:hypothetical protein
MKLRHVFIKKIMKLLVQIKLTYTYKCRVNIQIILYRFIIISVKLLYIDISYNRTIMMV